jgi:hypothetical protein
MTQAKKKSVRTKSINKLPKTMLLADGIKLAIKQGITIRRTLNFGDSWVNSENCGCVIGAAILAVTPKKRRKTVGSELDAAIYRCDSGPELTKFCKPFSDLYQNNELRQRVSNLFEVCGLSPNEIITWLELGAKVD